MRFVATSLCLALVAVGPSLAANRCVSNDGKISYQEHPCSKNEKATTVSVDSGTRASSAIDKSKNPPMTEAALRQAVLAALKDPNSADFKDVRHVGEGRALCGQVNAKNSYGGYSGFKAFVADAEGVYWAGDGSARADIGKTEARRTYVPRADYWGCL